MKRLIETLVWNSMLAEKPVCWHVIATEPPNSTHGTVRIDLP